MSGQIFVSYRRDDAAGFAGRLYDRLHDRFPQNKIFIDVDSIDPGLDFVEAIEANVGACDVLIAVIGKRWLVSANEEGRRRLDNPEDFVRLEIGTALKRGIRVIPVLVEGVLMPQPGELPDDLKLLTRRNAIEVSHTRFSTDSDRLIVALERVFEKAQLEDVPQSQLPSPLAPSIAAAQPEADKPSVETPKVVHPLLPKPSEPERVKPPPFSSGGSGGKRPPKQVIAFLAIAAVLVVGGLIYLVIRASQSPPPQPVPVAAVTPGPTIIETPSAEERARRPVTVAIPLRAQTGTLGTAFPVYVTSLGNNEVIKLDANGNQTVFSSNNAQQGMNLSSPDGLAFDASGNLYVTNQGNNEIVKIDASGNQSVFSSNNAQQGMNFSGLNGLAFDASGNLYVASYRKSAIIKLDASGNQTVFSSNNALNGPNGLAFDASGNLYVADTFNNAIIKLDANGNQTVFSPNNARQGTNLSGPAGLAFDASGNLYVASYFNNEVIKLDANGNQTVFSSNNPQQGTNLSSPNGLAFDASGNLYVANLGKNSAIVKLDANGNQTVFSSNNALSILAFTRPTTSSPTPSGADRLAEAKRYLDAKDYAQALPLLQTAAEAGNTYAMRNLGVLYENGQGVAQDYGKAREWYQKAAEAGNTYAKQALARLHSK